MGLKSLILRLEGLRMGLKSLIEKLEDCEWELNGNWTQPCDMTIDFVDRIVLKFTSIEYFGFLILEFNEIIQFKSLS